VELLLQQALVVEVEVALQVHINPDKTVVVAVVVLCLTVQVVEQAIKVLTVALG
jgi:hypothetical protein